MTDTLGSSSSWAKDLMAMYREGYSDAEVAAAMNISMRQFNGMLTDNPTFSKLVEFGRTLSLAWWEGQARKNVGNKNFNYSVWALTMKNKYGWADKIDTNNTTETVNYDLNTLRSEIDKKVKRLMKTGASDIVAAHEVLKPVKEQDEPEE